MPLNRRGSRGLGLRPVNSVKHIIETNGTVSAALVSITDVINTVAFPDVTATPNANNVSSSVHSIYLRVEVKGRVDAGGIDNIYMAVVKNPGNNFIFPALDLLGISDLRRFVIHQEMLMTSPENLSTNTGFPRTLFKGVIRVPRGYKRNALQDRLQVMLQHRSGEATQTTEFCIECIYKEFQ